ncbi:MAG: hypothetical protein MZV65_18735 [Chromatiales bacterium]|nr:hypothetical protein [Chromatiales bacterium]
MSKLTGRRDRPGGLPLPRAAVARARAGERRPALGRSGWRRSARRRFVAALG